MNETSKSFGGLLRGYVPFKKRDRHFPVAPGTEHYNVPREAVPIPRRVIVVRDGKQGAAVGFTRRSHRLHLSHDPPLRPREAFAHLEVLVHGAPVHRHVNGAGSSRGLIPLPEELLLEPRPGVPGVGVSGRAESRGYRCGPRDRTRAPPLAQRGFYELERVNRTPGQG